MKIDAKEIFNELTWISDSWDGEHISFNKDKLEGYLLDMQTKLNKELESRIAELEEQNREAVALLGRSHNLSGEQQEQIDYDYDVDCFLNSIKEKQ